MLESPIKRSKVNAYWRSGGIYIHHFARWVMPPKLGGPASRSVSTTLMPPFLAPSLTQRTPRLSRLDRACMQKSGTSKGLAAQCIYSPPPQRSLQQWLINRSTRPPSIAAELKRERPLQITLTAGMGSDAGPDGPEPNRMGRAVAKTWVW